MRWMLLVDTCGGSGGVVVADLGFGDRTRPPDAPHVVAERSIAGRETQEQLMFAIADVLRESNLSPTDLEVLGVVTGPGSFTGVRVGLAAVKGLAESLDLPVVGVSRLAVLAAQVAGPGPVQAWIDAGRGDVFAGRYLSGVPAGEQMLSGEDAATNLPDDEIAVAMEVSLQRLSSRLRLVSETGVRQALPLAAAAVTAGDFADPALLDANYLRVPDAELARRAAVRSAGGPRGSD